MSLSRRLAAGHAVTVYLPDSKPLWPGSGFSGQQAWILPSDCATGLTDSLMTAFTRATAVPKMNVSSVFHVERFLRISGPPVTSVLLASCQATRIFAAGTPVALPHSGPCESSRTVHCGVSLCEVTATCHAGKGCLKVIFPHKHPHRQKAEVLGWPGTIPTGNSGD